MFGASEVWGIAFGSSDLRAVKMSRSGEQVSLLEIEVIPYASGGAEEGGGDRELKARQALQALVAKHKIRRETIAIAVPGNAVFSKFITLPPVEKKRVPEIVKYESRQQIPFPIDEVVWDYQLVKSDLVPGEDIEVALFAIRREIVHTHLATCLSAGLRPQVVQAAPLAFCNFLQFDQPSEEPVAILDVGQESTELLIIDGERYWPRSLSVGNQDLTSALQQKFQISLEKAEELKVQAVKSKQADRLFGVMKPVLQNLSGQVQRTLGFYKSQHTEVRFGRVLLVGEFFDLPGIEGFFKETLRYEIARLSAFRRVVPDEGLDKGEFDAKSLSLGVAVGLGLQALGVGRIRTNLVPPETIQLQRRAAKRPWVAAAVLLAGSAVGLGAYRASQDSTVLKETSQGAEQAIKDVNTAISKLKQAREEPPKLLDELNKLPALLRDRDTGMPPDAFWEILKRVTEAVPEKLIWIDSLRIESVRFSEVPFLITQAKERRPPWCKDKGQAQTLRVTFEGRKVSSGDVGASKRDFAYVMENFVNQIQAIQSPGGSVPFCCRYGPAWFAFRNETENGVPYYVFTVDFIVNPAFFDALGDDHKIAFEKDDIGDVPCHVGGVVDDEREVCGFEGWHVIKPFA